MTIDREIEKETEEILELHKVEADLFCQHMGAQLGQEISKPPWTVDRCNPSLAALMSSPILSLSQAGRDQTMTCGKTVVPLGCRRTARMMPGC